MKIFEPIKDSDIRDKIRIFFYDCVYRNNLNSPISIRLGKDFWLSANSLNLLLLFIESISNFRKNTTIHIDLFDKKIVEEILHGSFDNGNKKITQTKNRIRFYEAMDFAEILYEYRVNVYPNYDKYILIRDKLDASPEKRKWKYSAKILHLNKLIEDELQQRTLSDRIAIMANILRNNLFLRITPQEARDDSEQIMFELVKNIYQHSQIAHTKSLKNNGFACAQINKYPLLNVPKIDFTMIQALFHNEKTNSSNRNWQFLSITINDFGIGLSSKLRSDLRNKLVGEDLLIGRYKIDKEFLESDYKLMLLAASTDFTTKTYDRKEERFLARKLENKGFGYIFCLAFIAKNYGRMEIRAGKSKIRFIAKPNACLEDIWSNITEVTELLQDKFDDYFTIQESKLSPQESRFPGTQVLIEIPVNPYN